MTNFFNAARAAGGLIFAGLLLGGCQSDSLSNRFSSTESGFSSYAGNSLGLVAGGSRESSGQTSMRERSQRSSIAKPKKAAKAVKSAKAGKSTKAFRTGKSAKKAVKSVKAVGTANLTGKYTSLIRKYARKERVPIALAMAVVRVESNFRANARGAAGEVGLMQLKPETARGMGYNGPIKALYDPETNIRWGMKYLGKAHALGNGSTCGTILKYNAGHGAKRMNKVSAGYCSKVKRIMNS